VLASFFYISRSLYQQHTSHSFGAHNHCTVHHWRRYHHHYSVFSHVFNQKRKSIEACNGSGCFFSLYGVTLIFLISKEETRIFDVFSLFYPWETKKSKQTIIFSFVFHFNSTFSLLTSFLLYILFFFLTRNRKENQKTYLLTKSVLSTEKVWGGLFGASSTTHFSRSQLLEKMEEKTSTCSISVKFVYFYTSLFYLILMTFFISWIRNPIQCCKPLPYLLCYHFCKKNYKC